MVDECEECGGPVEIIFSERLGIQLPLALCDECGGRRDAILADGAAALEAVEQAKWTNIRRQRSGLPPNLMDFGFGDIEPREELNAAQGLAERWSCGEVNGAVLSGDVGVGKTRLAIAATNAMVERRNVYFRTGPELMALLGSSYSNPARDREMEIITGSSALVLDDLDKTRPTELAAEAIFLAINERVEGLAPLMITTNLSLAEMTARWPETFRQAIASRLRLLEGVKVVGADRRRG